jgi:hypothetical protein
MRKLLAKILLFCSLVFVVTLLSAQNAEPIKIEAWITNTDRSALFEKQAEPISFRIQYNGRFANLRLNPGAVETYTWQ